MLTVPCVAVAAWERAPLLAAFRGSPGLEALLLGGSLAEHRRLLADTRVLTVSKASPVDAESLAGLARLKLLVTRSAAIDHIDLGACRTRGVVVANVPAPADAEPQRLADTTVSAVADWLAGREPANRVA